MTLKAPRQKAALRTFRDAPHAPPMVVVPAGRFVMGSGTGEALELFSALGMDMERDLGLDEEPAHEVRIACEFAIGRDCVCFDEYDAYARATGVPLPEESEMGRGTMPVVNVSWDDAIRYVRWLCKTSSRAYRLSSEAEWEYAARAGTTTAYWWGEFAEASCANYSETPGNSAFPVGSLGPNPWCLYNMNGNVTESVEDCFHASYIGAPADSSAWTTGYTWTDPDQGWVRVLRGGDWISDADEIRSSWRGRADGETTAGRIGFRVAASLIDVQESTRC